jgi:hypothetical protein
MAMSFSVTESSDFFERCARQTTTLHRIARLNLENENDGARNPDEWSFFLPAKLIAKVLPRPRLSEACQVMPCDLAKPFSLGFIADTRGQAGSNDHFPSMNSNG